MRKLYFIVGTDFSDYNMLIVLGYLDSSFLVFIIRDNFLCFIMKLDDIALGCFKYIWIWISLLVH